MVSVVRDCCTSHENPSHWREWNQTQHHPCNHDDVIKWKHFPRHWPFVRGIHRSPVNSPHKGQWRGALMFTLICARINGWVNTREAGDLRRYRAHCDVIVMISGRHYCGASAPMTESSEIFYLRLNKRLSQETWGWWFETPSHSLWRHCNGNLTKVQPTTTYFISYFVMLQMGLWYVEVTSKTSHNLCNGACRPGGHYLD